MAVRVIGVGASAGGLQALESFFSELPTDLGVAFVVIQHLSMEHPSVMDSILQRTTHLTVRSLEENTIPEPDHVYVKRPEHTVILNDWLRLTPREVDRDILYLPIDEFFFSLAAHQQEQAVGIVLSGMGTDGSRGLKEIKARGGLVMVQDPDSAQFSGMPTAALRQQIADVVLPPAQLASQLAVILRKDQVPTRPTEEDQLDDSGLYASLLEQIRKTTRIDFRRYRPGTIQRRIEKRMLITQIEPLTEYIRHALENEAELQMLRQSFLIGVTRFFRDKNAFDRLRNTVIPDLFTRLPQGQDLRVWVPSCSTGEEVYSVVMLIEDYLEHTGLRRGYRIFGSDVDRRAILKAVRGEYDETIQADVPPLFLERYFSRRPQGFSILPELKEHVLFAVQNLLDDPPFIRVDLITCRNFLIYINTDAQYEILGDFLFGLKPQGYLMLGPSEHLGSLRSAFTTVDRRWKVYQKRLTAKGASARSPRAISPELRPRALGKLQTISFPDLSDPTAPEDNRSLIPKTNMDLYSRYLSERFAPTTLFVNRQYDILYLNGDFTGILHLPRFDAHLSLRTVVNEDVKSLLVTGVDRVFATQKSGIYERVNVAKSGQPPRYLKVRFELFEDEGVSDPVAVLAFLPAEEVPIVDPSNGEPEVYNVDRRLLDRVSELEAELQHAERRAQKLYNELEATNEELQSSNRELLASNEELQSTNEELQSVNEELYTVNNEFQRNNEELNNINNDINNLLKSTQISTIFVDEHLHIRRFTPGIGQQFDLTASDLGRPLTSFANPFETVNIEQVSEQVLRDGKRYDQEVQDRSGDYYLLRILPYLTENDQIEGAVITFVAINDLVRTRRRLTDMATKYEAIFHNTQELIVIVELNSRITDLNRTLGLSPRDELIGSYFTDLIADDQGKVQCTENLRQAFDDHEVSFLTLSLRLTEEESARVQAEFIPIAPDGTHGSVEQTMIVIHDITQLENELQQRTQTIQRYERIISNMRQTAGLIDMNESVVYINGNTHLAHDREYYAERSLSEVLSDTGLLRYREAVSKLRAGAPTAEVHYRKEELLVEDHELRVRYRPIYTHSQLVYVSFEVVS